MKLYNPAREYEIGEICVDGDDVFWQAKLAGNLPTPVVSDAVSWKPFNPLALNNKNIGRGVDSNGVPQNFMFMDPDDALCIGSQWDVRQTIIAPSPFNMFRPQYVADFVEASGLGPLVATPSLWGTGNYNFLPGKLQMNTGGTSSSGIDLRLPYVPFEFVAGNRIYFYLHTYPNGNLDLKFGLRNPTGNGHYARFERIEDNTALNYVACVAAGGAAEQVSTFHVGDSVRTLFCIEQTGPSTLKFYIGNSGGQLELVATCTTKTPVGIAEAFVRLSNRAAVARSVFLDFVWAIPIR